MLTKILTEIFKGEDNKYHYFYKIVNDLNDNYYVGIHSTKNINDKYSGSGKILKNAYKKYGKNNFHKEILKCFMTRNECSEYERNAITNEMLCDNNCYNIKYGGDGWSNTGFTTVIDENGNTTIINVSDPNFLSGKYVGVTKGKGLVKNPITNKYEYMDKSNEMYSKLEHVNVGNVIVKDKEGNRFCVKKENPQYLSGELVSVNKDRKHSDETKKKISDIINGMRNDIFGDNHPNKGKHWINNGVYNLLVLDDDIINYAGWSLGRINCTHTVTQAVLDSCKDRCYINKDNKDKLVKKDIAEQLVKTEGWMYGRCRKHKIWVNNGNKSYMIDQDKINDYISNGYNLGRK